MKVAKVTAYGGPQTIVFDEVPEPVVQVGQVLVQVKAAPVTAGDVRIRSGKVPRGFGTVLRLAFGWNAPRNPVQGWSFAGVVLGGEGFAPGKRVFGISGINGGAHGQQVAVATQKVLALPEEMSFEQGAAFWFGGLTAAEFLINKAALQLGETVLINGATGAVGSAAIQIARSMGAKVTAVCSAPNAELARSLGAEAVIDYRTTQISGRYDVILDVIGTLPWKQAQPCLAPGGRLCLITADLVQTLGATFWPMRAGRRVIAGTSGEGRAKMERLLALYHSGAYQPVLGQIFAFDDIRSAHARAESFSKPGTLVLRVTP
jgi:NADPH:quinone reductase-like Zn-dependent oxidoreductase